MIIVYCVTVTILFLFIRYAWENIIGRYGKKMADYELHMMVNLGYKRDMIGSSDPDHESLVDNNKMGPQAMVERRTLFHNSLLNIVKDHHKKFCSELETPVNFEAEKLTRFHKDFDIDKRCMLNSSI